MSRKRIKFMLPSQPTIDELAQQKMDFDKFRLQQDIEFLTRGTNNNRALIEQRAKARIEWVTACMNAALAAIPQS